MCRLTIGNLRDWGYLREGTTQGLVTLMLGKRTLNIDMEVQLYTPYFLFLVIFSYEINGVQIMDRFCLEPVALKHGQRYYFLCPETGQRVTTLFFVNGRFGSRYVHNLTYRACGEHRQWYENARKYFRCVAKARDISRSCYRQSQYWDKSNEYQRRMADVLDRRVSKYEDQIQAAKQAKVRQLNRASMIDEKMSVRLFNFPE